MIVEPARQPPRVRAAATTTSSATNSPVAPERPPAAALDPQPIYEAYRRQIEHEDNLIGQRSSWLLMGQSFLVVGYCILHQLAPPDPAQQPVTGLLTGLIGWLGLATSASILVAVAAGSRAMTALRRELHQRRRDWPELDARMRVLPPVQPVGGVLVLGRAPVVLLPLLMCAFWLTMILATAAHG
ncbi:MAG: hypothetical protein LC135_04805 [Phycisphaerae bacterium]|jgi:hypothetical protein|nr:hypothetical protein [Phycisphaerae bacterium]MCZ2399174.1 hypothetical protein [Phycisphaerae bacterium]